jgi:hypothetical protein
LDEISLLKNSLLVDLQDIQGQQRVSL